MRLFSIVVAGLTTMAFAATAPAGLIITATADTDTANLTASQKFNISVVLSTTTAGEARGLTLRAAGWTAGDLSFVSATIPNFGGAATPTGALFGLDLGGGIVINALTNALAGAVDNGTDVVLFNGSTTGATTSAGPETFNLELQYNSGSGTIEIGAISSYGDAYVSSVDGTSTPTTTLAYGTSSQSPTVPEPSAAIAMGFLGVFGFAGTRRRRRHS